MKGIVRYKSTKSVAKALDRFHKEEIVVQDVGVMIKLLESETPVAEKAPSRSTTSTFTSSYGNSFQNYDSRDTIGYPDGSLGGGRYDSSGKRYRNGLDGASDSGRSVNSRSSRASRHSRNPSGGAASTNSGKSGRKI